MIAAVVRPSAAKDGTITSSDGHSAKGRTAAMGSVPGQGDSEGDISWLVSVGRRALIVC